MQGDEMENTNAVPLEEMVDVPVFLFGDELPRGFLKLPRPMADDIAKARMDGLLFAAVPQVEIHGEPVRFERGPVLVGMMIDFVPSAPRA
jgi:hypothetical protein